MKWLFAALVALNIIVFGGMITHRLNNAKSPNAAPVEGGAHELAQPESLRPQQAPAPADNAQPDWLQTDETQADLPEPESEEAIAERKKKEEEEQARREKEKKNVKKKPAAKKKKPPPKTPIRMLPPTKILPPKTHPPPANVRLTPALPWTKTTTTASKAC
ncbi:hypothetical protein NEISICOT_00746 [Neisseria sicca ATCC 29256]|uniref:Uncharacterized protein n=1 Tax=Neisseria sicca ATCC 29256 TaxID=547045 RepID=C6M2K8_NEISI|nr:hypothetical protein [Neisseria sicca]EET45528.1 hypothetical protein NEISICOT_00746 [Neisseria sicca ATCC 29256]